MDGLSNPALRVVGARQTLRAIEAEELAHAYVARDADPFVTRPVVSLCEKRGVPFTEVESMAALGKACGIQVRASVAGVLKG